MDHAKTYPLIPLVVCFLTSISQAINVHGVSVYKQKLNDPEAVYFTPENFNIQTDGKKYVSDELQKAINKVSKRFGN